MKNNLFALLLGLAFSLLILGTSELFFQLNEKTYWINPPMHSQYPPMQLDREASLKLYSLLNHGPAFHWKPTLSPEEVLSASQEGIDQTEKGLIPCCLSKWDKSRFPISIKSVLKTAKTHRLIYSANYKIDSLGRRITPNPRGAFYNILMFGDSFTLGEGVNDKESAPYQLGKRRPDSKVYNLGIAGGSSSEILYELIASNKSRFQDIPHRKTLLIYSYMDDHLERLFCRSLCLLKKNEWMLEKPYFASENGKPVFKGFFDQNRQILNGFYKYWNQSALVRFFNIILPPRFEQKDFDFFAEVLKEIETQSKNVFQDVDFYFVLYPGASHFYGSELKAVALKNNIHVLDFSSIDTRLATGGFPTIPGDGHPSPITQYIFAYLLNKELPVIRKK